MSAFTNKFTEAIENRKHRAREAVRLRALAEAATTPAVKARLLEQAQEHARLARLAEDDRAS
jgi:hypothetical protein